MGTDKPTDSQSPPERLRGRLGADEVAFVDAVSEQVASLIDDASDLGFEYLVGDLSDVGTSSSGHLHFDLVHGGATVHCVLFASRHDAAKVDLEEGIQAAVAGDLSYWEEQGKLSVIVDDVIELGTGIYQQTYEQHRQQLADEGLFASEAKQALPRLPTRVGIATSVDSDARTDAVTSIHDRHPDIDIVVRNTGVQGDDALIDIMEALAALDEDSAVDVIVLTRGGGADKDLRVFNEPPLCRAIYEAETPVVVAVGHESDRVLAEEVADRRVMTPTDVGEIVPEKAELEREVQTLREGIADAYLTAVTTRLEDLDSRLSRAYEARVEASLSRYRTDLRHAFATRARERMTAFRNQLESARKQYHQQREHERTVRRHRRERRRLVAALVGLGLLVVGLLVFIVLYT